MANQLPSAWASCGLPRYRGRSHPRTRLLVGAQTQTAPHREQRSEGQLPEDAGSQARDNRSWRLSRDTLPHRSKTRGRRSAQLTTPTMNRQRQPVHPFAWVTVLTSQPRKGSRLRPVRLRPSSPAAHWVAGYMLLDPCASHHPRDPTGTSVAGSSDPPHPARATRWGHRRTGALHQGGAARSCLRGFPQDRPDGLPGDRGRWGHSPGGGAWAPTSGSRSAVECRPGWPRGG